MITKYQKQKDKEYLTKNAKYEAFNWLKILIILAVLGIIKYGILILIQLNK